MKLAIALDRPGPQAPGTAITGRVEVHEGGSARALAVTLVRTERSPDYAADRVVARQVLAAGELAPASSHPFSLTVPDGAPPAVRSTHGALGWEVQAHADRRGRDVHEARPVDVGAPDTV